jgi:hypothetical protein
VANSGIDGFYSRSDVLTTVFGDESFDYQTFCVRQNKHVDSVDRVRADDLRGRRHKSPCIPQNNQQKYIYIRSDSLTATV